LVSKTDNIYLLYIGTVFLLTPPEIHQTALMKPKVNQEITIIKSTHARPIQAP